MGNSLCMVTLFEKRVLLCDKYRVEDAKEVVNIALITWIPRINNLRRKYGETPFNIN
jgi:hypothetical protein